MKKAFRTIGITARSDLEDRDEAIETIFAVARDLGVKVLLDGKRCRIPSLRKSCGVFSGTKGIDLLVVLGGDGTIMRAIREMDDFSIPILSINRGTVGFLTELSLLEARKLLPGLLKGQGMLDVRSLLFVRAVRGKKVLFEGRVLNEAVVSQGAISRLIDLHTTINGEALTTFHADGVIMATPTGSTAYSLAAGGPIVHPQLRTTIVTPINPHSFSQKPIIIPADQTIEVTILTKQNKFQDTKISLTLDGQTYVSLQREDRVEAKIAKETIRFLRRKEDTFFETLRNKLKWGEAPETQ